MSPVYDQLLRVLRAYLTASNAEGLLLRTTREMDIRPEELSAFHLPRMVPAIERRARLYLDNVRLARLVGEISGFALDRPSRRSRILTVEYEADISIARQTAKAICDAAGGRSFNAHKVATIVSELARNIVAYTPGGTIELEIVRETAACVRISAVDRGSGIAALDDILAGRYRSRTGLGKGIVGVQRLADKFNIHTGPAGTKVEVEVRL
ncbi:MAG: ATP-binding protein [Polyangiaceae bacterium]|nr:ATP-binding protein [Polyangiaceae bacterium]